MTILELDVTSGKSVREAVNTVESHPLVVEKRRRRMMRLCSIKREGGDGDKENEKDENFETAEGRGLALGGLDILINNAGMLSFMPLLDINFGDNEDGGCSDGEEERTARRVFEVNFWGALRVIRGFRGLLAKDFPAGGGRGSGEDGEDDDGRKAMVVNISSMAGEVGVPWMGESLLSFSPYHLSAMAGVEGRGNVHTPTKREKERFPLVPEATDSISSLIFASFPIRTGIYSASKSALTHLSTILANELLPLNINVQTPTAGMILSGLTTNAPDFRLPEGSFYKPIEEFIVQRTKMEDEARWGTERKEFAKGVVRDVVGERGGMIRKGAFAGGLAWGRRWLGGWVMVSSRFPFFGTLGPI